MKVDRTKFLLLTGAISAAATAGMALMSGCTSTTAATSDAGAAPDTGTPTDDSGPDSTTEGGDGGACLDNTGAKGDCSTTTCAATCGTITTQQGTSATYDTFKNGVSADIVACLVSLPTCEGATADVNDCIDKALAKTCDDPAATTTCQQLVNDCNALDAGGDGGTSTFTLARCTQLVRALTPDARTAFVSCVDEGTAGSCKTDPGTCIDTFTTP